MRTFSSYGPINTQLHYHAPRTALIDAAYRQLVGENPQDGGHYVTVWAPRQTGKTWIMQQVMERVRGTGEFEVAILTLQSAKNVETKEELLRLFVRELESWFEREFPQITQWRELDTLFQPPYLSKPLILIIDEFDALNETFINQFANEFRSIYTRRINQTNLPSAEKSHLLHGLALIGVRSVLGIENVSGSPFNVQRSIHIPNLTQEEVQGIFEWYQTESGQQIVPEVIAEIFEEFCGQPGLTCWMGELLTEQYNRGGPEITVDAFNLAYATAIHALPNNNILNIISKAKQEAYKPLVLELYRTAAKLPFRYDNPTTNFLYMNGVVDYEVILDENGEYKHYLKFPSPFVQKRLFNYFAHELFMGLDHLHNPLLDLSDTITDERLDVPKLMQLYETYLQQNRAWLFKDVPRRKTDERIYEAVYHFHLYMYLSQFLQSYHSTVVPEFPTGNGKVDLIIRHGGAIYGLEVKSFVSRREYQNALRQAAAYGQQLGVQQMWLILFIELIDEENRRQLETVHVDVTTGVAVRPVFVTLGWER